MKKPLLFYVVVDSLPSVVRFIGHVQLKGVRPRTVEAYLMMVRLLACHAGQDPALLEEEQDTGAPTTAGPKGSLKAS